MRALVWLFSRFAAIALLRAGPQDLPPGRSLLPVALAFYVAVDVAQAWPVLTPVRSLLVAGLDTLLLAAFVQLLLRSAGKSPRFVQTLAALYGAGALLGVFGIPLAWRLAVDGGTGSAAVPPGLALALFAYLGWNLLVMAHVLRHALERGLGIAMALSLLYFFLSQLIMGLAFPGD